MLQTCPVSERQLAFTFYLHCSLKPDAGKTPQVGLLRDVGLLLLSPT